ncbi:hypothetical protein SLEP1_g7760 [Rubroshorea leprosula]|uniref:Uncharacterized protein n=1 Tax=Rubroshorea leprosula TaxID=152421 RepID=A0AAV5I7G5_9ROSI|nr:hypothetical protein SLEP1_g7760 [Rubroshorea leprosula]
MGGGGVGVGVRGEKNRLVPTTLSHGRNCSSRASAHSSGG